MSNKKINNSNLRLLFCTPSYSGNGGSSLNERQSIEALSKRVSIIYVVNLLNLSGLLPAYRHHLVLKSKISNIKIINIPVFPFVPERFVPLYIIRLFFYDFFLVFFA